MKVFSQLVVGIIFLFSVAAHSATLSLKNVSPVVISTYPVAGTLDVDPSTTHIKVTFSKDMMTNRAWSVIKLSESSWPQITGQPSYLSDHRTIIIPVKLKANTVYAMRLNSIENQGFKDVLGIPAESYLLVFKTAVDG